MPKADQSNITPSADAELLVLCSRFRAVNTRFHAAWNEQLDLEDRDSDEYHRLEGEIAELSDTLEAFKREVMRTPAATFEGLRAKAQASIHELTAGDARAEQAHFQEHDLQHSLACDVLRLS